MQTYKRRLSLQQIRGNGDNDIFAFLPDIKEYFLTESVRGGLEVVIDRIGKNKQIKVMLPVFIAEGVIRPFRNKGASVIFYKLDKNLRPDISDISNKLIANPDVDCILVVHYFGFSQDLGQLYEICQKHQCLLLEDCVHALFSKNELGNYLGQTGDISFFSFAKILPVPDGGIFFINNSSLIPLFKDINYSKSLAGFFMVRVHLLYLLLKSFEVKLNYSIAYKAMNIFSKAIYLTYYSLLKKTRKPQRISAITLKILKNIDYDYLITQRKIHTQEIYRVLIPIKHLLYRQEYDPNCLLTGVPIISTDCDIIVPLLRRNNIECLSYKKSWFFMPESKESEYLIESRFVQNHFLLPVHENNTNYSGKLQNLLNIAFQKPDK